MKIRKIQKYNDWKKVKILKYKVTELRKENKLKVVSEMKTELKGT